MCSLHYLCESTHWRCCRDLGNRFISAIRNVALLNAQWRDNFSEMPDWNFIVDNLSPSILPAWVQSLDLQVGCSCP